MQGRSEHRGPLPLFTGGRPHTITHVRPAASGALIARGSDRVFGVRATLTAERHGAATPASSSVRSPTSSSMDIVGKRLMTDNAFAYVHNRSLRELLARHAIRHLRTQPYRPRTNGKVERFYQNDGTRIGIRARLPLTSTPQRRPATLAQRLQPATATAQSATGHPSAAFTTSVGRTTSRGSSSAARRLPTAGGVWRRAG